MSERCRIVELWKRGASAALITLVRVEGSSYRRPGARLLIAQNGEHAGSISGGCLEADMLRQAAWKVRDGAVVETYSTLFDDDAEIPYGLGCGGVVDVLLEPATTPEFTALMQALEASLKGTAADVVTTFDREHGLRRHVMDADGKVLFETSAERQATMLFRERIEPPQRLIVFGAGDDAQPLVRAAYALGWRVAVVDSRSHMATAQRFPEAECVVTSADTVNLRDDDAIAIMTHSYEQDRRWLTEALSLRARYLGLLGARQRSALLLSEAAAALGWELADACAQVFAPMGLDLGGDGAEAIALATLAEMQACVEGRLGEQRRMSEAQVREAVATGGAARYLATQCAL